MKEDTTAGRLVVFVLGGPGVGKGTQCKRLVDALGCRHLSAGDLLRAEQGREGSPHARLIEECIRGGQIVPAALTVSLLRREIEADGAAPFFLVDGFPRAPDQWTAFDADIQPARVALLFLAADDATLASRCLGRASASHRIDDNAESIHRRLAVFHEQTEAVRAVLAPHGPCAVIDGDRDPDLVFRDVLAAVQGFLDGAALV